MEQIAVCEYCGQTFISDLPTEAERKKEAIKKCSCPGANSARRRLQKIDEAKIELIGVMEYNPFSGSEDGIVDEEKVDNIRKGLEAFIENLADGDVRSLTVQIPGIGKVTMTSSDKSIKISKRITTGVERKIES
ncbi:MAG: hypothetical protein IJ349_05465 [Clostridia bacterium]|nr:hypothetical protein [Clostridia bacterium]